MMRMVRLSGAATRLVRRLPLGRGASHGASAFARPVSTSLAVNGEFSDVLRFETLQPRGGRLEPEDFEHKAVLVINTASQCGYTKQLASLQALHERFHERGLVVVAVPSNDFGGQEPGSDDDILAFYTGADYKVSFPIATKAAVVGDDAHPFFKRIVTEYNRSVAPTWNFDKFLIDHFGDLRAVFPHDTDPLTPEVAEAIEEVLDDLPPPLTAEDHDGSNDGNETTPSR